MTMTPRKEEFARLLSLEEPLSIIEAYEKAGYSIKRDKSGKPSAHIYVNASKLASEDDIVERVNQIRSNRNKKHEAVTLYKKTREEARKDNVINKLEVLADITQDHEFLSRDMSAQDKAVMLKALQLLGQPIGLYTERVVTQEEPKDSKQLEADLKAKLVSWFSEDKH